MISCRACDDACHCEIEAELAGLRNSQRSSAKTMSYPKLLLISSTSVSIELLDSEKFEEFEDL